VDFACFISPFAEQRYLQGSAEFPGYYFARGLAPHPNIGAKGHEAQWWVYGLEVFLF
jgi:hypothetical protein